MTVRLLCVGDIHLGRSPGGLGGEGGGPGIARGELGPREAWGRTVQAALEQGADGVLLAGDVVDADEDFFEGYSALRAGVERLVREGVRVLGVAGNHDVLVLPRLADQVQGFQLLGRGGRWELARVEGREGGALDILGWSFPRRVVSESPLASLGAELFAREGAQRVGLLHADLDQRQSPYAPVRRAELEATGLDAWILGHVHKPSDLSGRRPIGYLGSITALDASEIGPRGPWLLEADGATLRLTHMPIAPLRFEELAVDVTGADDVAAARERILEAVRGRAAELGQEDGELGPRAIGLRLLLVGRTRARAALEQAALEARAIREPAGPRGELVAFVERAQIEARPEIDLEASARRSDPLGLLAAQLLLLERQEGDPERAALLGEARGQLARRARQVIAGNLEPPALDDRALARRLRSAGDALLDGLLRQEAERGGAA